MSFYAQEELDSLGFKELGQDVQLSNKASFYGCERISIGSNTRIDDFVVISAGKGGVEIGKHVHIAVFSSLIGAGKITLSNFCNISSRVSIYSSNDDYSGAYMTNPTVPNTYTNVNHADVLLKEHVIVGCGSVVLPGVTLNEGVAIGALSLVNTSCKEYGVYSGTPIKKIKDRKRDLTKLTARYLVEIKNA